MREDEQYIWDELYKQRHKVALAEGHGVCGGRTGFVVTLRLVFVLSLPEVVHVLATIVLTLSAMASA